MSLMFQFGDIFPFVFDIHKCRKEHIKSNPELKGVSYYQMDEAMMLFGGKSVYEK